MRQEMLTLSGTPDFTRLCPFMIYTLHNLSVLGLCLRIHDSGLFAWISQTALSQTYIIIAATKMDPVCILKSPSQPHTKRHNYIFLLYIYLIVMRYSYPNALVLLQLT